MPNPGTRCKRGKRGFSIPSERGREPPEDPETGRQGEEEKQGPVSLSTSGLSLVGKGLRLVPLIPMCYKLRAISGRTGLCSDSRLQAYEEFPPSAPLCLALSRPAHTFHCLCPDRR